MTKDEAIKWFGSRAELARQLGVSATNVPKWTEIPKWHQKSIERITNGELKADPDDENPNKEMKRVSYYIPKANYELFKNMCKKQDISIRSKINDLIEKELRMT